MSKIKALFFDTREYEIPFFQENLIELCDITYTSSTVQSFELTEEFCNETELVSVFTPSRLSKETIKKFKKLKLIVTRSTGFSHVDVEFAKELNIPVLNVRHYGDASIAEFAFGLMLNVARKIDGAFANIKNGIIETESFIGYELSGKTIGIIGAGAIGSHAIKIAKGFNMDVIVYDIMPNPKLALEKGFSYVSLEELFCQSDFISIHAYANAQNKHMIDKHAFAKMKDGVIIVNTARGEIMDTEALYMALKSGKVAGAGLDVLECEEMFGNEDKYVCKIDCINTDCLKKTILNHKMLELQNVIVTPHIAFDTKEAIERIMIKTVQSIEEFLLKKETPNNVY